MELIRGNDRAWGKQIWRGRLWRFNAAVVLLGDIPDLQNLDRCGGCLGFSNIAIRRFGLV
jgi:hypothetical protein